VVVRRDGLESQPASSVFPTPIFCRGDAEEESGLGANSLLVNTERCFPILAPDSWLLTAGRVECWSGGSKRRPGTTGPFGISYANFLPRGRGGGIRVEGEQPFGEHREVFSYSGS
jgi:hypothetical protein